MHPLLLASTVEDCLHKTAIGLRIRQHRPGAVMTVSIDDDRREATLDWTPAALADADLLDRNRITEDSA